MRHDTWGVVAATAAASLISGAMSTATAPAPAAGETRPRGRAHVTTIGNFKGGPGKTSVCVNLAAALARKGYKVLVVDMDAQANATRRLDAQTGEDSLTVSQVIERGARQPGCAAEAIVDCGFDAEYASRIKIIPSTMELTNRASDNVPNAARRLHHALAGATGGFDYVLIDISPSLGALTHMALAASDDGLVPTEPETDSMEGAATFTEFAYEWRTALEVPGFEIIGFIVSKVRGGLKLHRQRVAVLEDFVAAYFPEGTSPAPVWEPHIPLATAVNEAHEGKAVQVVEVEDDGSEIERTQLVGVPVETHGPKGREIREIYDALADRYVAATGGA